MSELTPLQTLTHNPPLLKLITLSSWEDIQVRPFEHKQNLKKRWTHLKIILTCPSLCCSWCQTELPVIELQLQRLSKEPAALEVPPDQDPWSEFCSLPVGSNPSLMPRFLAVARKHAGLCHRAVSLIDGLCSVNVSADYSCGFWVSVVQTWMIKVHLKTNIFILFIF